MRDERSTSTADIDEAAGAGVGRTRHSARKTVSVATWNVNSVRARLDHVIRFLNEESPDILCMQETKVDDNTFPAKSIAAEGYDHYLISGQRSYNGVAIFSRLPLEHVENRAFCGKDDKRHLSVRLPGGVELHNFYVPAGGDVPDPEANDKFAHKLAFMTEIADWFRARRDPANRMILVGDLNVAPLPSDVWSHKALLNVVSHTPIEVEHMEEMLASHDWIDVARRFVPDPEPLFTWWSYRSPNWEKADKGRRLDHIWVTPALAGDLVACRTVKPARGWLKPSDHIPVVAEIALPVP